MVLKKTEQTYPKGHWMGVGIALGFIIGMPAAVIFGIVVDEVVFGTIIGPSIGAALGVSLGAYMEKKHEKSIRPLTPEEKKMQKITVASGMLMLLTGIIALLLVSAYAFS